MTANVDSTAEKPSSVAPSTPAAVRVGLKLEPLSELPHVSETDLPPKEPSATKEIDGVAAASFASYEYNRSFESSFGEGTSSFGVVACLTRPPRRLMRRLHAQKNWYHPRWLPRGTDIAAVSNICMSTIGIGTLSMPFALAEQGFTMFLVLATFVLFLMGLSIYTLCKVADHLKEHSFEMIARNLWGHGAELFVEVVLIAGTFGSSIAYCVVIGDIADMFGPYLYGVVFPAAYGRMLSQLTVFFFVMFPMCLLRSLQALRYASLVGVAAITTLVVGIIVAGLRYGAASNIEPLFSGTPFGILSGMPLLFFGYVNQVNGIEIYAELPPGRTPAKFLRLSFPTYALVGFAYVSVGVAGLSVAGTGVMGNILKNFAIGEDVLLTAAFVGIFIKTILTFPLLIFPTREAVFHMRGVVDMDDVPTRIWAESTVAITFVCITFAILVPNVTTMFSLIGALCASLFGFVLPAGFALWIPGYFSRGFHGWLEWALVGMMLVVGIIIAVVGTCITVLGILGYKG